MFRFLNYLLIFTIISCKNELGFKSSERSVNSPSDVPNLLFWFDGSDILGNGSSLTNGTSINTNWVDKSGNTQFNLLTGSSPTLLEGGLNGKSVVDFGGAGALSGNFATNFTVAKFTALIVMRMETTTPGWGGALVMSRPGVNDFDDPTTACIFIREGAGSNITNWRYGSNVRSTANVLNEWHLFTQYYRSGNEMVMHVDGVPVEEDVYGEMNLNSSKFTIGGRLAPAEGFFLNGQVAEVLFYQGELNPSHLEAVENYLLLKWGL
jgi:hypothetical protein